MRRNAVLISCLTLCVSLSAEEPQEKALRDYFVAQTRQLAEHSLARVRTREQWQAMRPRLREQLLEMLGLQPFPQRTPLQAKVTGTTHRDGIVVENIHFQSLPGLYVTANLYRPANMTEPLPTILYVCGHGRVRKDGVSYGNKTFYQHHGAWFARNGYVCLTIDTIQLGELEGIHHGTYRENMWWWLNRGYTPAGVEAWNSVRALDYLETREEVDATRFGITGRSGGGAYSWWTAAIDERIKVAVPVAGITDLQNHVVDGTVEGHCDCMFMVNTYRWDYDLVAAMLAPRPLLISNTDRDGIFPLDGVYRTYVQVRRLYELLDAEADIALQITAGPHKDTQELRIHAFRWFHHYLKHDDSLIQDVASQRFDPEELKVFEKLPDQEITTTIHESFVRKAPSPASLNCEQAIHLLREHVFRGWPGTNTPPSIVTQRNDIEDGLRIRVLAFESQPLVPLQLLIVERNRDGPPTTVRMHLQDDEQWRAYQRPEGPNTAKLRASLASGDDAAVFFSPRGMGPLPWHGDERKRTQRRRRFYLLGQSLDGMRVFDVQRAVQALRTLRHWERCPVEIHGRGRLGAIGLYASLFAAVQKVTLAAPPNDPKHDPHLLNVRRFFDLRDLVNMARERHQVELVDTAGLSRWQ